MTTKTRAFAYLKAVSDDKRPLTSEMESIVASMKNLSGPAKQKLVAAFADVGPLEWRRGQWCRDR